MYGDNERIEAYLNAVATYEDIKKRAAQQWQEAFLSLARAQLSHNVSPKDHDPTVLAVTAFHNGALRCGTATDLLGAWPSDALKRSQNQFVRALELEVQSLGAKHAINKIM